MPSRIQGIWVASVHTFCAVQYPSHNGEDLVEHHHDRAQVLLVVHVQEIMGRLASPQVQP